MNFWKRVSSTASLLLVGVLLCFTPKASAAEMDQPETFEAYGYGDRTASSMFGALEYYFPVPQSWALQEGTTLDLVVSHSPLLRPNRSTMTVFANDVAVHSTFLDESNQNRDRIQIPLPVDGFQDQIDRAEGYTIRIQFFMRLTDLVCEETNNPALWATVHRESALTLQAEPREIPTDLSYLPYPFLVKNNAEQDDLAFAFTNDPSTEEIETAFQTAAYFGGESGPGLLEMQVSTEKQVSADTATVTVGFSPQAGSDQAPASLTMLESRGQPILALQGESPLLASEALLHSELFRQLEGQSVQVRRLADPSLEDLDWPWKRDAATFSQLGAQDRTVRGVGEQSVFFYFSRPAGWELSREEIFIDLHLTRSPLLLPEQSGLKLRINGMDMDALAYTEEPNREGFFRFQLPADVLNVTAGGQYTDELVVEFVVEHQLLQSECEPIYAENAWTTIHADSYFYLPHTYLPLPDLSVFPYPFLDPNEKAPLDIVLPSVPTDGELEAALMLAHLFGKQAFGSLPEINLLLANEVKALEQNAILIGAVDRNPWVKDAEESIPPERRGIVQTAVSQDAIGNLKVFESPWQNGKWILVISGEEDLVTVAAALGRDLTSASVTAVRADGSSEAVFRDVNAPRLPQANRQTRPSLLPQPETWQVILAVFVFTALAVLLAIVIYRRSSA